MAEFNLFDQANCTRCGDCFRLCPQLHLQKDEAVKEINALIEGKNSKYVLSQCTTCFTCNLICKNGCKPYQLILQNWNQQYIERGAPPIYRFVCPTLDKNIWQMLEKLMPKSEREIVSTWMNQKVSGNILLIGNYTHLFSFILSGSILLSYFTPVDLIDHWEAGAYLYQGGYLDVVKQIGKKCKDEFNASNVNTVVAFLDAVEFMINTTLRNG